MTLRHSVLLYAVATAVALGAALLEHLSCC